MANIKHILTVMITSVLLVVAIAYWIDQKNEPTEVLLENQKTLEGPTSTELLKEQSINVINPMNRIATFKTSKGEIKIELFEDKMPITTGNFIKLAEQGFYNETKFHRVIDGFMIQGGDPNSKGNDPLTYGTGGPGYTIQDEFVSDPLLSNVRGTIAMANTGQPNSGGSQFFINTVDNTGLDFDKEPLSSKHPVFGRIVGGMDIVDSISAVKTGTRDVPIEPVVIESIVITQE
jgi:peptidylprolyl isomerase